MRYFNPLLVAGLLLCSLSLWGCTHQKTGAISAKIHELESRYAKLEEDYRVLQTLHDQNRKRLSQSEALRASLDKQNVELARSLETTTGERDDLRKQVSQRTTERDNAQAHLVQFSKELRAFAGRIETALNNLPDSSNLAILPASRRVE